MIFPGFSHAPRSKVAYMPIVNEINFLKFIRIKMKLAYPDFIIKPDPEGHFALSVKAGHLGAPCLTADLCDAFRAYGQACREVERQVVIEEFLSAVGNTVFNMDTPILPETFLFQLYPQADVSFKKGEIFLPFIGDLAAVLMRAGDSAMRPVTLANLDVLGLSRQQAGEAAMHNTSKVSKHVKQEFDVDWPGLIFFSAGPQSASSLIYRDFSSNQNMPDGAYFVCDNARYVYASARDEVAMATLVMYQHCLAKQVKRSVSGSLLLRQRGNWRAADLTGFVRAA
jgi:hypothetical protein